MNPGQICLITLSAVCGIGMLIYYARSKHPLRYSLIGMVSGTGALCAVKLVSLYVVLPISINFFTIFWGLLFGVPGVIGMTIGALLL